MDTINALYAKPSTLTMLFMQNPVHSDLLRVTRALVVIITLHKQISPMIKVCGRW